MGGTNSDPIFNSPESDTTIILGMLVLILPSVAGGWALRGFLFSGSPLVFIPPWLKLFIPCLIITSSLFSVSAFNKRGEKQGSLMGDFVHFMWFIPFIFRRVVLKKTLKASKMGFKGVDSSWLPLITWGSLIYSYQRIRKAQGSIIISNFLKSFVMVIILMLFVVWLGA